MNIRCVNATGKTMRVLVEEVWVNEYLVEAENLVEATRKILDGELGKDYFSETKRALPKRFVRFLEE